MNLAGILGKRIDGSMQKACLGARSRVTGPHGEVSVAAGLPLQKKTSSSAAAERPREPLSRLKSCQVLHNCTKNHI